jgi:hypothetical protein
MQVRKVDIWELSDAEFYGAVFLQALWLQPLFKTVFDACWDLYHLGFMV